MSLCGKIEFKNIIEMPGTSIDWINQEAVSIYATQTGIIIESSGIISVAIYSVLGQKVYESNIQGNTPISLSKGIYLVKAGKAVRKMIIN